MSAEQKSARPTETPHRPKVLIIYPYEWLAYAPTVARLYRALAESCDVQIIAYDGGDFCRSKVDLPGVEYITLPGRLRRVAEFLCRRFPKLEKRWHFFHIARAVQLWRILRGREVDDVLASDYSGMWVAQKAFGRRTRLHFLSLEIYDSDLFASRIDVGRVDSAIVQSPERFEWLFPRSEPPVFYVQNAPVYRKRTVNERTGERTGSLVYCGTALPRFGLFRILEFLRSYPQFQLTIQGLTNEYSEELMRPYAELRVAGRLVQETQYLSEPDLLRWLEKFRVGLCFYDFDHLPEDQFNYRTVPSGKLFNYFAAGVPVVGNDIPGLHPVREFNAGILVRDLSPEAIAAAVIEVQENFATYHANCLRAAEHYSFDRAVAPFREFLLQRRAPASGAVGRAVENPALALAG